MNQIARTLLGFLFFDVLGSGVLGETRSEVSNIRMKKAPLAHGEKGSAFSLLIPYPCDLEEKKTIGFLTRKYLSSYITANVLGLFGQNTGSGYCIFYGMLAK